MLLDLGLSWRRSHCTVVGTLEVLLHVRDGLRPVSCRQNGRLLKFRAFSELASHGVWLQGDEVIAVFWLQMADNVVDTGRSFLLGLAQDLRNAFPAALTLVGVEVVIVGVKIVQDQDSDFRQVVSEDAVFRIIFAPLPLFLQEHASGDSAALSESSPLACGLSSGGFGSDIHLLPVPACRSLVALQAALLALHALHFAVKALYELRDGLGVFERLAVDGATSEMGFPGGEVVSPINFGT